MNKHVVGVITIIAILVSILFACNKDRKDESTETLVFNSPDSIEYASDTYREVSDAILSDNDFKTLLNKVSFLMGKCVNSEVSALNLSFNNTSVLCTQIDMCEDDFENLIYEITALQDTLSVRYNLTSTAYTNSNCLFCSQTASEKIDLLQNYILTFQNNSFSYDLKDYYYPDTSMGGDDHGPCEHQLRALLCLTVCTATLAEIPVLMLICYYECLCNCCPNHPFCGSSNTQGTT